MCTNVVLVLVWALGGEQCLRKWPWVSGLLACPSDVSDDQGKAQRNPVRHLIGRLIEDSPHGSWLICAALFIYGFYAQGIDTFCVLDVLCTTTMPDPTTQETVMNKGSAAAREPPNGNKCETYIPLRKLTNL